MTKFLIALTAATGIIVGGVYALFSAGQISQKPSFFLVTMIFLYLSTVIMYRYLYRLYTPGSFVQLYLFMMVIKLMAYLGYNVFLIINDRSGALANVAFFMAVYFLFTVIEIWFLYRLVNNGKRT